jgi:hypothetical protein
MSNGRRELELGWEGLKLETASGHFRLTSANGLQMLDDEENPLVTFGKYNN